MRRRLMAFAATVMVAAAGFTVALLLSGWGAAAPVPTPDPGGETTITKITKITKTIPTATPVTIGFQCRLADPQPRHPLELNMVAVGNFAKAIAMEKEVSICEASGDRRQIRDHETFIEVVEQAGFFPPSGARTVSRRVETATCVKDLAEGTVDCSAKSVPIGPALARPLTNCHPASDQPADPVEMKTVVFGVADTLDFRVAKTVKVEKEVYHCPGTVADLYIFSEILEKAKFVDGTAVDIVPVAKGFHGIICFKIPIVGAPPSKCNAVAT